MPALSLYKEMDLKNIEKQGIISEPYQPVDKLREGGLRPEFGQSDQLGESVRVGESGQLGESR